MTLLLIVFAAIAVLTCLLARFALRKQPAEEGRPTAPTGDGASCGTCTGQSSSCMQDCMMEASTRPVEYFDDEELDTFRGRNSADYEDEEIEQFAEVLHTMRPEEVSSWLQSLTLRGIQLPDALKDEAFMFLSEPS